MSMGRADTIVKIAVVIQCFEFYEGNKKAIPNSTLMGKNTIFLKHFHLKEHRKQWRTPQTAHRFDYPIARKSRLKSLVTSQLIRNWYELWRHRQIQRQFFSDRMIVSMRGLWGSSLFSGLFSMTVFLTVFKMSYSSPLAFVTVFHWYLFSIKEKRLMK